MSLYENLLERTGGHEYNGYFSMCCPFPHQGRLESHPSMFVYESGTFRCSACHAHGTLKSLERKIGSHFHVYKSDAKSNILPQWSKWGDSLEEIAKNAHEMLKRYPQFQGYYKRRGVEEFIERGYLGYNSGWSVLPVFDANHKIIDMVVRAIKGKGDTRYVIKPNKDGQRPLYCPNWERVVASDVVYVPFGIFDAVSFELIGLASVTSITGQSINSELLRGLNKRLIIIPDRGEEDSAHKIANILGWRCKVKEIDYPSDTKDPDEVRRIYGRSYLLELLDEKDKSD